MENKQHPEYVPPEVTTYTDEQILEELGPAQTVSGAPRSNLGV